MQASVAENLELVVHPVVAPGAVRRWSASVRISGTRAGAPFTLVLDLYGEAFDSEAHAVRYGTLKAEARLQALIEHDALP